MPVFTSADVYEKLGELQAMVILLFSSVLTYYITTHFGCKNILNDDYLDFRLPG